MKVKVLYEPSCEYLLDPNYDVLAKKALALGYDLFKVKYEDLTVRYTPFKNYIIAEFERNGYYPIIFRLGKTVLWTKADKVEAIKKDSLIELLEKHKQEYGDGKVYIIDDLRGVKKLVKFIYGKRWRRVWDFIEDEYYYRLTNIKYLHELIDLLKFVKV